jgi:hypothetical protein
MLQTRLHSFSMRALLVLVLLLACGALGAQTFSHILSFQGRLCGTDGKPMPDGVYSVQFTIYDAETEGTALWTETLGVTQAGGVFTAILGLVTPFPGDLFTGGDRWMGIKVGEDAEMAERQRLTPSPWAIESANTDKVDGLHASATPTPNYLLPLDGDGRFPSAVIPPDDDWTVSGDDVCRLTGNVGIGVADPGALLHLASMAGIDLVIEADTDNLSEDQNARIRLSQDGGVVTARIGLRESENALEIVHQYGAPLILGTGNAERVRISADGNLGIGIPPYDSARMSLMHEHLPARAMAYLADTTYGGIGVWGEATTAGGYFQDDDNGTNVWVGYGSYKIKGNGSVSFVQSHPDQADRVIVYACPEGDEVATYTRGTARLVNGVARVPLGETFKWVTNPDIGLTAHLTPRGEWADLYVKSVSTRELVVASRDPECNASFDYIVYGLRIGFEESSIVQEKEREAHIPSMAGHRALYERQPDLRTYNALERFKRMRAATGEAGDVDLTASQELRDRIVEFDPAIHAIDRPAE